MINEQGREAPPDTFPADDVREKPGPPPARLPAPVLTHVVPTPVPGR
jgi:hypothetical protein